MGRSSRGGFVTSIAVDPLNPLRVYAATAHGLFVSGDEGENWKPLAHGLLGHFVGALAIEPGHSRALYVGTNEGGLLRAAAGGKRWTRLDSGLGSTFVSAIAFDPAAPGTLYLGTNRGVFRSRDQGDMDPGTTRPAGHRCLQGPARRRRAASWTAPSRRWRGERHRECHGEDGLASGRCIRRGSLLVPV